MYIKATVSTLSPITNDIDYNLDLIQKIYKQAVKEQSQILVYPEYSITGYHLEDTHYFSHLIENAWQALQEFTITVHDIIVFIGLPIQYSNKLYNGVACLFQQKIYGITLKERLPNNNIFHEKRHLSASYAGMYGQKGSDKISVGDLIFHIPKLKNLKIASEICEDSWYQLNPGFRRVCAGAEIITNSSASPFWIGKKEERHHLFTQRSRELKAGYLISNLNGTENGKLIFDGSGDIYQNGQLIASNNKFPYKTYNLKSAILDIEEIRRDRQENTSWQEETESFFNNNNIPVPSIIIIDNQEKSSLFLNKNISSSFYNSQSFYDLPFISNNIQKEEQIKEFYNEICEALTLGLCDYIRKVGFKHLCLSVSGGQDSSMAAIIMARSMYKLQTEYQYNITATTYYLQGLYSTKKTHDLSRDLITELQKKYNIKLEFISEDVRKTMQQVEQDVSRMYKKTKRQSNNEAQKIAQQNIQARVRANISLSFANYERALVIGTSNMSEIFLGYSTAGGDNQGGLALLANLPKTIISKWLNWFNQKHNITSISEILLLSPSAELSPEQKDEEELAPYWFIDRFMYLLIIQKKSILNIVFILNSSLLNSSTSCSITKRQIIIWIILLVKMFYSSQWKREQMPHGFKIFTIDLNPHGGLYFPVISYDKTIKQLEKQLTVLDKK